MVNEDILQEQIKLVERVLSDIAATREQLAIAMADIKALQNDVREHIAVGDFCPHNGV